MQDPIAIVGVGCRLPGNVDSPDKYWSLIRSGRDGIGEIPSKRLDISRFYDEDRSAPGKIYVKNGGFIDQDIDAFDSLAFGISPREAAVLDPQQRLLLEVAWEAIEDAGVSLGDLAGSETGVFVGGFMVDGLLTQFGPQNRDAIGSHTAVSSTLAILSNRISHAFDLRGPSFTVDTACSSSLVAVHLACEAIRRGECAVALCGGVNVIFRPEPLVAMCKGGFLAADGRSKSFDARADGYGRGEGAGVVVLKPLADALRDGDRVYAVLRGSGVNQDGRTDGITVPNAEAQRVLIERVCAGAGIAPGDVDYVEAHGTGTALGDPLEARALGETVGAGRGERPCPIGSVKANIGHLEAAAGIAGLLKTALCLHNATVPPLANLETPNPAIPFETLGLRLPRAPEPLGDGRRPALASVNSFGYGGTNAHVVLAQHALARRESAPEDAAAPAVHALALSARSETALRALAGRFAERLSTSAPEEAAGLCRAAAVRRHHHEQRLVVVDEDPRALAGTLERFAAGGGAAGTISATASAERARPVLVFTGMGPQWWGMGRRLLADHPVARAFAEEADALFRAEAGWSVLAEMGRDEATSRMARTAVAQPANFVLQGALHALVTSWGVEPAAIVGHSVGEVAAAHAAGVLSLEDAVRVSFHRSRIQQKAAGQGAMLAAGMAETEILPLVYRHHGDVAIAAVNGPSSVTLAGETEALREIAGELDLAGAFNRWLTVEVAYHSGFMEPLKPELREALAGLAPGAATLPLYSTVRGALAQPGDYDAEYWCDNIREPVYFAPAVDALIDAGHRAFVEVGPHPVLSSALRQCLEARGVEGLSVATLRRGRDEAVSLLEAAGRLYAHGARIDWRRVLPGDDTAASLPTYPFQRERLWSETESGLRDRLGDPGAHPLLGTRTDAPAPAWSSAPSRAALPWLADHEVEGLRVMPGAAYVEIGLALDETLTRSARSELRDVTFSQALVHGGGAAPVLATTYDEATRTFSIASRRAAGEPWIVHARGTRASLPFAPRRAPARETVMARCPLRRTQAEHLIDMAARGLGYAHAFQTVRELWLGHERGRAGGEALARIEVLPDVAPTLDRYRLHPSLLDGAFQTLLAASTDAGGGEIFVPVAIASIRLHEPARGALWCHARCLRRTAETLEGELTLSDGEGRVVAEASGVVARALTRDATDADTALDACLYEFAFPAASETGSEAASETPAARTAVLCADAAFGVELARALGSDDRPARRIDPGARASRETLARLIAEAGAEAPLERLVLAARGGGQTTAEDAIGLSRLGDTLEALQAALDAAPDAEVVVVTRQALAAPGADPVDPTAAALVGLARTALNEHADRRLRMIDTSARTGTAAIAREIARPSTEDTIVLDADRRFACRLERREAAALHARAERTPPAAHEIECGVRAVVDGRHVLGTVTARGAGVETLAPGDAVLVRCPADDPAPLFVNVEAHDAVALPRAERVFADPRLLPMAIARHALDAIGRVRPGDGVVVDLGDGALARAAVDGALALSARPLVLSHDPEAPCWAGSPAERLDRGRLDVLETLDARLGEARARVVLTRDGTEFRDGLARRLGALGRLVEIDGDDARREPARLGRNRLGVRLDTPALLGEAPAEFERLVDTLATRKPRASGQDGTILRRDGAALTPAALARSAPHAFDAAGTYLITGGLGGLGLRLARWLVDRGVRRLALMGRRAPTTEAAVAAIGALEAAGASVRIVLGDVARHEDVERVVAEIGSGGERLRGVFHAAGVLDDAPFASTTRDQLATVARPKAQGAWNLHLATCGLDLTCFVMVSSLASLVGSPGQAAYVAANGYLDALAHRRRWFGLPAVSVNLGALAEVGMAARHEGVGYYLSRVGVGSIAPDFLVDALDRILLWNPPQIGLAPMDWRLWGRTYPAWAASSRYRHLVPADADGGADEGGDAAALRRLPAAERPVAIERLLTTLLAPILRLDPARLDPTVSLLGLGLDSLMAIECQTAIQRETGMRVATLVLLRGDSLRVIARDLSRALDAEAGTPDAPAHDGTGRGGSAPVPPATARHRRDAPAAELATLDAEGAA
ncbi:MAG: SDR family NAD(P)-dependent oxidoreductase [Paracoccaceae bacterium]